MLASDRELPVSGGPEKRAYVRDIFTAIAPTYDRLNRIISLRLDQRWRRYAVRRLGWERRPDGIYLDLCAGTLDFAATLARQAGFRGRIVGADFVAPMLRSAAARRRAPSRSTADALELPFPEAVFDGAMVGWGLRNLVNLDAGLAEAARVLRPGSRLVILDMALPTQPHAASSVSSSISGACCPGSGDGSRNIRPRIHGYQSRPSRSRSRPSSRGAWQRQGFREVSYTLFMGGVCAMHVGTRSG